MLLWTPLLWLRFAGRGQTVKKAIAEPYRDIDFSNARRGPVIRPEPGKTKVSIRLDKRVLDHFRSVVERASGGNYQTLINDALVAFIDQQSMLEAVRKVVREELASTGKASRHPATEESLRARG